MLQATNYETILEKKIDTKSARIGVIGLGYVGLPTTLHFAKRGYFVTGLDLSIGKVKKINEGISYIQDVKTEELSTFVKTGYIQATTNMEELKNIDILFICVPTPINDYKEPDLSYVQRASQMIAEYIESGTLVILESTTFPGTTEEYVVPLLQEKGWVVGEDVFVAYSPERVDPGNRQYSLENTPKVVGGITQSCSHLAAKIIGQTAHIVSNVRVAEMCKIFENSFRWINMAFVNEIACLCKTLDIDVWEMIDASATKPYGFMRFTPGMGVGGHCIPVDPYYLTYRAKKYGEHTKMINLAGELNEKMKKVTYDRIIDLLLKHKKLPALSHIVVLGISYKENLDDIRESPVLPVLEKLMCTVQNVHIMDPYVKTCQLNGETESVFVYDCSVIEKADIVVIATPHDSFPYKEIVTNASLVLDIKNTCGKRNIKDKHIYTL
ncbi:UDP-N-acetyl-D-glucosamine dehydrogenase [Bacillus cereus]|uniref:UDP-N-acetyl-D-glucosamine dehydrogenase n=1 Tax=Bacillus cereus TaxID=1396 RepID=A0A9X7CDY5_BACCE|nr:nucleotide sugar dehydrogenase [Bacillus cereus]PGO79347.1 UDP-N-acetyl-D-glucosamine dehydrogenase [Bacillus cereus]